MMIKQKIQNYANKAYYYLGKSHVAAAGIVLLVIQSAFLALSAIYPLPFDEYYHVGIIKIYAQQWSPWIANQTEAASLYGDVTRMPSYLYHYLMSFPYRFFDFFIDSETALIICLRLINIALVVGAILIFRKLFLEAGTSKRLINLAVLIFAITPIVPFLAAHVNYDNSLIVMMSISFLLAYRLIYRGGSSARLFLLFVSVGMLGSLMKYTFLLLLAPLFIFTVVSLLKKHSREVLGVLFDSFKRERALVKLVLIVLILVSSLLFIERIGINLVKYHGPSPDCEKIQKVEVCEKNMPWYRNNQAQLRLNTTEKEFGNPVSYGQHWVTKMMRGYFAIFSHTPTNVISPLEPFGPIVLRDIMPLPITVAYVVAIAGLVAILIYIRELWNDGLLRIVTVVSALYLLILFTFNYTSYLKVGAAYAIQARYTYPILLPIFILIATAFNQFKIPRNTKIIITTLFIVIYAWGAGVTGWIIRSDSLWYWQNNIVIRFNQQAQNALKIFIPH